MRSVTTDTAFIHSLTAPAVLHGYLPQASICPLQPALLHSLICKVSTTNSAPVILCVGTDRMIGDCLGPMVGSRLEREAGGRLPVYGTLKNTVHALNIRDVNMHIKKKHPDSIVIAVDASLGSSEQIGSVYVHSGCLHPGAGVNKKLPAIGDIAITGITNAESRQPYLALQTARLSTIADMADIICGCIQAVCL